MLLRLNGHGDAKRQQLEATGSTSLSKTEDGLTKDAGRRLNARSFCDYTGFFTQRRGTGISLEVSFGGNF